MRNASCGSLGIASNSNFWNGKEEFNDKQTLQERDVGKIASAARVVEHGSPS
jgi:hypothetical protein